jgi:hypothetical protein
MTYIKLTHANFKKEVILTREQVWAIYYSESHQCTHIVSTAGAIVPVSESVDDVNRLVYGAPVIPLVNNSNTSK